MKAKWKTFHQTFSVIGKAKVRRNLNISYAYPPFPSLHARNSRTKFLRGFSFWRGPVNTPLTPLSNQDRISPYNIKYIIKQISDGNKEKYQLGNYYLIHHQILHTNILSIIWQTVKRITNEILAVKGFICFFCFAGNDWWGWQRWWWGN